MTFQLPDSIEIDGRSHTLAPAPRMPESHPRIVAQEIVRRRPHDSLLGSTANPRGYVASWSLSDGRLFLDSVKGRLGLVGSEPLFADWVTDVIAANDGDVIPNRGMGIANVHERSIHLRIEGGVLAERWVEYTDGRLRYWLRWPSRALRAWRLRRVKAPG
jgi:hypothetical protein